VSQLVDPGVLFYLVKVMEIKSLMYWIMSAFSYWIKLFDFIAECCCLTLKSMEICDLPMFTILVSKPRVGVR
jgi:hypothetical protein